MTGRGENKHRGRPREARSIARRNAATRWGARNRPDFFKKGGTKMVEKQGCTGQKTNKPARYNHINIPIKGQTRTEVRRPDRGRWKNR